jgi:hypothetical protein
MIREIREMESSKRSRKSKGWQRKIIASWIQKINSHWSDG